MSYRFLDGKPVRSDTGPPPSNENRILWLEQRVADLEACVILISEGNATRDDVIAKLKGT